MGMWSGKRVGPGDLKGLFQPEGFNDFLAYSAAWSCIKDGACCDPLEDIH